MVSCDYRSDQDKQPPGTLLHNVVKISPIVGHESKEKNIVKKIYCISSFIKFSSGSPVLGCAQPSCIALSEGEDDSIFEASDHKCLPSIPNPSWISLLTKIWLNHAYCVGSLEKVRIAGSRELLKSTTRSIAGGHCRQLWRLLQRWGTHKSSPSEQVQGREFSSH